METRTIRPNGGRSRKRPRWSYRCMVPARRVKSLRKQPELGALIRGQALGLAGVDRGLGDPVAQRLLRAAQITGDPGDRLAAIAHQPHRLSPELRRIGRPCSSHRGLPSGGRGPQSSGVHETEATPIRTLDEEWAHGRVWDSSHQRARDLCSSMRYYNRRRPHSSLGDRPPISRVQQDRGHYT